MVITLRELFAKSKHPSHDDKESAVQVIASLLEQAQEIGHQHAQIETHERSHAWGRRIKQHHDEKHSVKKTLLLVAAWQIVTNFVQRIIDWMAKQAADLLAEDDVIAEVDMLAETVASVEIPSAIEQEVLDAMQDQGFLHIAWIVQPDDRVCKTCRTNADQGAIPIGTAFASGDNYPPAHPRCRCSLGSPEDQENR